jgi:NADH:ubiquinone oxidoreductase subunit 3 (subunit A)
MFLEYILIFKYLIFCFLISFLLFGLSFFIVIQLPNAEKISIYECGSNPFNDSRSRFEVRFYIVAILFMIFDLEIVFLFPWVLLLDNLTYFGFFSMIIFLILLTIGFIYEWVKGALNWE